MTELGKMRGNSGVTVVSVIVVTAQRVTVVTTIKRHTKLMIM